MEKKHLELTCALVLCLILIIAVFLKIGSTFQSGEIMYDGEYYWTPVEVHLFKDGHCSLQHYWHDKNWEIENNYLVGQDFSGKSNAYFTRNRLHRLRRNWLIETQIRIVRENTEIQILNRDSSRLKREGGVVIRNLGKAISLFCSGDIDFKLEADYDFEKDRWYTIWLQKYQGHWKLHIDGVLIMETTADRGPGRFSEPHFAVFNKGEAHFRYYKYYKPANTRIIKKRIGSIGT